MLMSQSKGNEPKVRDYCSILGHQIRLSYVKVRLEISWFGEYLKLSKSVFIFSNLSWSGGPTLMSCSLSIFIRVLEREVW